MDIQEIKDSVKDRVQKRLSKVFPISLIYIIYQIAFPFNIFFFCIESGINFNMVRFVNKKKIYAIDCLKYIDEMWEFLYTGFLRRMLTFLNFFLLIIPGIIKHYQYALVPMILTDPELKEARGMDCLKLSQDMMNAHLFECFLLDLSFLYWHILAIPTFFILEINILPYHLAAKYKLLSEIKNNYMGQEPSYMLESDATYTPVAIIRKKKSKPIPINRDKNGKFVPKYCMRCGQELPPHSETCLYCGYIFDPEDQEKDQIL